MPDGNWLFETAFWLPLPFSRHTNLLIWLRVQEKHDGLHASAVYFNDDFMYATPEFVDFITRKVWPYARFIPGVAFHPFGVYHVASRITLQDAPLHRIVKEMAGQQMYQEDRTLPLRVRDVVAHWANDQWSACVRLEQRDALVGAWWPYDDYTTAPLRDATEREARQIAAAIKRQFRGSTFITSDHRPLLAQVRRMITLMLGEDT